MLSRCSESLHQRHNSNFHHKLLYLTFSAALSFILHSLVRNLQANRQTLMFSATMPNNVQAIASIAMKPSYEVVDCVGEEENTHEHVPQK